MATSILEELPLTETNPDLQSLESKVLRAIELLNQTRAAKADLERELDRNRQQLRARDERISDMDKELISLRKDREHARERVERMISQIDELIASETE
jgi:septation ring formation regulator EzrA